MEKTMTKEEVKLTLEKAIIDLLINEPFYAGVIQELRRKQVEDNTVYYAGIFIEPYPTLVYHERLAKLDKKAINTILKHECLHLLLDSFIRQENREHRKWNIATDLAINSFLNKDIVTSFKGCYPGIKPFEKFQVGLYAEKYYDMLEGNLSKEVFIESSHNQQIDPETSLGREIAKDIIRKAAKDAKSKGQLPYKLEEYIDIFIKRPTVNWKKQLQLLVGTGEKIAKETTWKRPNRRFGVQQKGYRPLRSLDLIVAIDTSGSIQDKEFEEFINEIYGIQKSYKSNITIIECDAEVQKIYKINRYKKIDTKFKGRGGTDFRPVFNWMIDNKKENNILIYFTDSEGRYPEKTKIKTIWVIPQRHYNIKPPFGRVILIPELE